MQAWLAPKNDGKFVPSDVAFFIAVVTIAFLATIILSKQINNVRHHPITHNTDNSAQPRRYPSDQQPNAIHTTTRTVAIYAYISDAFKIMQCLFDTKLIQKRLQACFNSGAIAELMRISIPKLTASLLCRLISCD